MPWENVTQYDNPNSCWHLWKPFYLQTLDRHAPFRCMRTRGNSLPWITPNIKNLMRARYVHKKKAVKFNSQLHWAKYKDTRNKVNSELYKAKKKVIFTTNLRFVLRLKIPNKVGTILITSWVRIINQTTFPN